MDTLVKIIGVIGIVIIFAMILALPTYFLWNWLMPDIFGLKTISLLQALGLNFLSGILFKTSISSSKD